MTMSYGAFIVLMLCCGSVLRCTIAIRHHILTKSWDEAQDDCLAYLRFEANDSAHYRAHHYEGEDTRTKELLFCIVLNLRAYEPSQNAIRAEVLSRFFQPDSGDTGNVYRTNECLRKVPHPPTPDYQSWTEFYGTAIEKVYGAFRCFYHHYGNLNRDAPPLPVTPLELDQVQQECAQIVSLPLKLLTNGPRLRVHPLYNSFRRCVGLRTGYPDWELDDGEEEEERSEEDSDK